MQGFDAMLQKMGLNSTKIQEDSKKVDMISQLLGMLGINPDKMLGDAQAMLQAFEDQRAKEHNALLSEFRALNDKLGTMDQAIKALNPDYVPEEFKAGELVIAGESESPFLTNPDHPDGGAVDMDELDRDKLAAAGLEPPAQAAKPPKPANAGKVAAHKKAGG